MSDRVGRLCSGQHFDQHRLRKRAGERRIYLAVGINISIASVLSLVHSPWWLLFPGFVGAAMVWFAATGFCIMANGLYWLGAEPPLGPEPKAACPAAPASGQHAQA